jgi:hypothetical protein
MKYSGTKLVIFLCVIAILFRVALFIFAVKVMPPSSDEALPALMAFHILKGEFPVVYWGQTYMGTQESYITAALIPFLGFNVVTIRLYPFFISLIFCWATYLLTRKLYGESAGIFALAMLAIPVPYLAMCGAMIPPDNYLAVTTLGSIAFLPLADMVFAGSSRSTSLLPLSGSEGGWKTTLRQNLIKLWQDGNERPWWKYVLIGFILGYTFWLHILVISYIAVALLFLFLSDKLVFLRWKFWAGVLAFCAGSLPFLWYNITHDFATFSDVGRTVDWQRSWELFQELFIITTHFLIGMKVMFYGDSTHFASLPTWLSILVAVIAIGMLLLVILTRLKSLLRLAILSLKGSDGTALLLALLAAIAFMFCRSTRSAWHNVRYIMPMMSALPILLAGGLAQVQKWSRAAAVAILLVIIASQAWGDFLLVRAWNNPKFVAEDLELPDTKPVFAFLKEHGIYHAYAHYWLSYRMTFESHERFICSEPFNERFPGRDVKFIDQVRSASNVAYINHATLRLPEDFETNLKAIGGEYRKVESYPFTGYYDFKPPYGSIQLQEIARSGWKTTAAQNTEAAGDVLDNDLITGWCSVSPQTSGTWFHIDLGRIETICKIRFDLDGHVMDCPRGYKIEVSSDGTSWKQVLEMGDMNGNLFWEGSHPWILVRGDFFTAAFPSIEARYVRMVLTASDPKYNWSIAELRMFGPKK